MADKDTGGGGRRGGERRGHATRERIIAAAGAFLDGGGSLADLHFTRIAREIGLHQATLYYYFDDRNRLAAEILRSRALPDAPLRPLPGEALPAYIGRALDRVIALWTDHGSLVKAGADLTAAGPDYLRDWTARLTAWVPAAAAVARADPAFRPPPGDELEELLTAALWMIERNLYVLFCTDPGPDPERVRRRRAALLRAVLAAVGHPAAADPAGPADPAGAGGSSAGPGPDAVERAP
jgi:AcrR family transcriptional regulator